MKRITKAEKKLLLFIGSTTMGLVSMLDDCKDQMAAWRLSQRQLLKRHQTNLPFCGSIAYWSLTPAGWKKYDELKSNEQSP